MPTQKQIAASRENGRQSGDPLGRATTPEGKARSLYANFDTGIFAEYQGLSWESQEVLEELRNE